MKRMTRRLLSRLLIFALFLSMLPSTVLTGTAETENPGQQAMADGAVVIQSAKALGEFPAPAEGQTTVTKVCPVCKTEKAWTALVNGSTTGNLTGHYYLAENLTTGVSVLSGQRTLCLNLNGKNITAGPEALSFSNSTMHVLDTVGTSVVTGVKGAAIYLNGAKAGGTANFYGGTYTKSGSTTTSVVSVGGNGGTVNFYAGTIQAGGITNDNAATAINLLGRTSGANAGKAVFNFYDGTIYGGTASGSGGAIRIGDGNAALAQFNIYGGTVSGGTTAGNSGNSGGSIYVNGSSTELHLYGGAILNGCYDRNTNVLGGGNIALASGATLNMEGGILAGGSSKGFGGNIFIRDTTYGHIRISGGKIFGGQAANKGDNIAVFGKDQANMSTLTISGGEICGDIFIGTNVNVTLSGSPKIKTTGLKDDAGNGLTARNGGLFVTGDSNIQVGDVATGAQIQITGDANTTFTAETANADLVAKYFSSTNSGTKIVAENNRLKIVTKVVAKPEKDVFAPWDCEGLAYCPACMAQGKNQEAVVWTAFDPDTYTAGSTLSGHYYLTDAVTDSAAVDDTAYITPSGTLCFNLDGHDLTTTNGRVFFTNNKGGTLNVMDTAPVDGTVTGYYKTAGGAVFHLSGGKGSAKVNIYGGRFTKVNKTTVAASKRSSVVHISANGGTVNMYGGCIDTTGVENTIFPTAVYLSGGIYHATNAPWAGEASFVLHDGVIKGGSCTGDGGLIRVGNPDIANGTGKVVYLGAATFTMNGGAIYGGTSMTGGIGTILNGGNVYVGNDCKLVLNGGTVGGDILARDRTSVAAEGDEELYPQKTTVILSGDVKILTRYGATKAKATGLYIEKGVAVNADGLTEGAEVYIAGALQEILFQSSRAEQLKPYIKAYDPKQYVEITDNGFWLGVRIAAVQTAEKQVFYPTADQALAAYYENPEGAYVQLFVDSDITLLGDAYIDSCGNDVSVFGSGVLYLLESANDTYNHNAVGKWTISGAEVAADGINPVNGRRYIALQEAGKPQYTAHRVELHMTHVTLDTAAAGFYYKAVYTCDDMLAARVKEYGIILSANGIPRQESFLGGDDRFSVLEAPFIPDANHTVSGTSTKLTGIFKDQEDRPNAEYGARRIYATPYFTVDVDGDAWYDQVVIGYVENAVYLENNDVTYTSRSMLDVMTMIDKAWNNTEGFVLGQEQRAQVQAFYQKWSDRGMNQWAEQFEHIDA